MGPMKARNANSVRMVLSTGCRWTKTEYNVINDLISAARTNKLVLVLEVHDTTGYGEQAGACTLAHAANYCVGMKNSLVGNEKHVIINIGNESYGNLNTPVGVFTADPLRSRHPNMERTAPRGCRVSRRRRAAWRGRTTSAR